MANDGMPPDQLPPAVREYLAWSGRAPEWADAAKLVAGERVFWRYGPAIVALLNCYSLPFCYAGRKGVQVLALTSRVYSNPTRHRDRPVPAASARWEPGVRTARKVRLMHAGVRFQIRHTRAGSFFSYLRLNGLRRLGYRLTNEEAEAYLHCWNVVGRVMGVPSARPRL